jgi:hypothetical protein
MATKFDRLLEGEPQGTCVFLGDGCRPQHDDIDPLVGNAVMPQGARDPAGGMISAPWFHPRAHALFKISDDLVCDPAVYISEF